MLPSRITPLTVPKNYTACWRDLSVPLRAPCHPQGAAAAALQLENSRLREEVDALKRRLPGLGLLRRTSSSMQLVAGATEQLLAELNQVGAGHAQTLGTG